jgi:2'-5' RNA ligase
MTETTVRSFLAFEIPDGLKSRLASDLEVLRESLPRSRWTRPQGWHLTLKFLGEVERPALADLVAELEPRVRALDPVTVELSRTGFFPTATRPRVAWIGGSAVGSEEVLAAVESAATAVGLPRERRPWSAHLTLARMKSQWSKNAVSRFLEWGDSLNLEEFTCWEVVLFRSDLQPGGAVYTALERCPFG